MASALLLATLCAAQTPGSMLDDWHYPAEEAEELAVSPLPLAVSVDAGGCSLLPADKSGGATAFKIGDVAFGAWHVVGALPDAQPAPCVVLEREFERHGLLAFVFAGGDGEDGAGSTGSAAPPPPPPRSLRKSAGRLSGLRQPYYNFTGGEPSYFTTIESDNGDFPSRRARNRSADGELSYGSLASTLAPQRDTAAISLASHVVKFAVAYNGRIKCASRVGESAPHGQDNSGGAGLVELQDQRAAAPNNQTVVFDPRDHLSYWPSRYEHAKAGLLGGSLSVANVAAFSPHAKTAGGGGHGYELLAFGAINRSAEEDNGGSGGGGGGGSRLPACQYSPELNNTYIAGFAPRSREAFDTLAAAEGACDADAGCGGVTRQYGHYGTRAGGVALPCTASMPTCETHPASSWLLLNASKSACRSLPRTAGVDYSPSVLVRLREQSGAAWTADDGGSGSGAFRYFRASNATTAGASQSSSGGSSPAGPAGQAGPAPATASEFYGALLEVAARHDALLAPMMRLRLPGAEGARQLDMARSGMLNAVNNDVGNQSNYGFGASYWSISREDNGSLPLTWLAADEALLEWGACGAALGHIGYFFANNVALPSGEVNYWGWGGAAPMAGADSISDYGRMVDLFIKATMLCPGGGGVGGGGGGDGGVGGGDGGAWAAAQLPFVEAMGRKMLRERADAVAGKYTPPPPAGCAGLVNGAPEHDWGSVKDKYFFNNNAWQLRGIEVLGDYLTGKGGGGPGGGGKPPPGANATLGKALLADALGYRKSLEACVAACTVEVAAADLGLDRAQTPPAVPAAALQAAPTLSFLGPYAANDSVPYKTMGESRESSYANFRFWSETAMAEQMPRAVEATWLNYHNAVGGRVGGSSKFEAWLDDMPATGWGFGALANNATDAFQALLYGHMATYQSRGTFHSTEQLSFNGEGLYRAFNFFKHDPLPAPDLVGNGTEEEEEERAAGAMQQREQEQGQEQEEQDQGAAKRPLGYYGTENDISFCAVTNVMAARLTRWQLVMEDAYRGRGTGAPLAIWLARGAPRRWFAAGAGGFAVDGAPTRVGRVSYSVVTSAGSAAYSVAVGTSPAAQAVAWKLRWPAPLTAAPRVLAGCSIEAVDMQLGIVSVRATAGTFSIEADF